MRSHIRALGVAVACSVMLSCVAITRVGTPILDQVGFEAEITGLTKESVDYLSIQVSFKNNTNLKLCIYPRHGHIPVVVASGEEGLRLSGEDEVGITRPESPLTYVGQIMPVEMLPGEARHSEYSLALRHYNYISGEKRSGERFSGRASSGNFKIGLQIYALDCTERVMSESEFERALGEYGQFGGEGIVRASTPFSATIPLNFPATGGIIVLQ